MTSRPIAERGQAGLWLRAQQGRMVRALRLAAGLRQRDVADALGFTGITFVSSVETGRNAVPPEGVWAWAHALGHDPRDFARRLLAFQNPWAFAVLFDVPAPNRRPYRPETLLADLDEALGTRHGDDGTRRVERPFDPWSLPPSLRLMWSVADLEEAAAAAAQEREEEEDAEE